MEALKILIRKWQSESVPLMPSCGTYLVRATFLGTGIEPPKDLVTLYSLIGGMEDTDDTLWRLWPLSEVDGRKLDANEFGVLFADYLIDSWAYRIKPNNTETSSVYVDYYDGRDSVLVAETLEEFFNALVEDAEKLIFQMP